MATVKVTQKDYFKAAIAHFNGEDIEFSYEDMVEFFEGRLAVLEKKSANRKTKVNKEDEAYKATILQILQGSDEGMTVTAIGQSDETLSGLSNQKVSALLRKMVTEGKVTRTKDKKTTLFSVVA